MLWVAPSHPFERVVHGLPWRGAPATQSRRLRDNLEGLGGPFYKGLTSTGLVAAAISALIAVMCVKLRLFFLEPSDRAPEKRKHKFHLTMRKDFPLRVAEH